VKTKEDRERGVNGSKPPSGRRICKSRSFRHELGLVEVENRSGKIGEGEYRVVETWFLFANPPPRLLIQLAETKLESKSMQSTI